MVYYVDLALVAASLGPENSRRSTIVSMRLWREACPSSQQRYSLRYLTLRVHVSAMAGSDELDELDSPA